MFYSLHDESPTYWYEGRCPQTGTLLRLPRTTRVEAIAVSLMEHLATDEAYSREGKMYGVLLAQTPLGEERILKAFSGSLNTHQVVEGWVPPIPGRDRVALEETRTLASLDQIGQELLTLQRIAEREQYQTLKQEYERNLQNLTIVHQQRKQERQQQRQDEPDLKTIFDRQSQLDGIERKRFKQERDRALKPLQDIIGQADARIHELKLQRKILSRKLQAQMYSAYSLTNFSGRSVSLEQLMVEGGYLPTGTGDCCAPKLLHYAATQGLEPLAMAEFWWGKSTQDRIHGEFYGACVERCQPLMGFLLSGSPQHDSLSPSLLRRGVGVRSSVLHRLTAESAMTSSIHEDEWLIAVDKPSGLLSVPGRYQDTQDSVLSRLRQYFPDVMAVHRLDMDTSGILLLARNLCTYQYLSQQFQERNVRKIYEALLVGMVIEDEGIIELPLWGDPQNRPHQIVDRRGKPSVTRFKVLSREGGYTRIEFTPPTGRTHQLRVHAADRQGLGCPILGDRLYGDPTTSSRLHLHARELTFKHPQTQQTLHLRIDTPF